MTANRRLVVAWGALILLSLINYQVVVVLCNDFIVLKFLRDLLLIYIIVQTFARRPGITPGYVPALILLAAFLALAALKTQGLGNMLINIRKYLFPVGVLVAARSLVGLHEREYRSLLRFAVTAVAFIAAWGVFQAYILKDQFLINLGYPTIYSYAYGRTTLNYSFYFGNLGIQRVTGTISNSNVFAIILGVCLVVIVLNKRWLLCRWTHWLRLGCIALAYVGTVSRSNFLAMILVAIVLLWRYIPHKDKLPFLLMACIGGFAGLYLMEGADGLAHKLVNWVVDSLTLKDTSAAGRGGYWAEALEAILHNPMGIGYGKTGIMAVGSSVVYECENSYLAMALDLGWLGLASYLLLLGTILYDAYLAPAGQLLRPIRRQAIAVIIYMAVVFCFSNHIYDMEAITMVYFVAGVSMSYLEAQAKTQPG